RGRRATRVGRVRPRVLPRPRAPARLRGRDAALGRSALAARLDPELAARVEHGHQADDAAVALDPAPREGGEGHALAGDEVDLAADVLEADDPVAEQRAVAGLPVREVVGRLAPG